MSYLKRRLYDYQRFISVIRLTVVLVCNIKNLKTPVHIGRKTFTSISHAPTSNSVVVVTELVGALARQGYDYYSNMD